tara:strand:+ start:376 stop:1677 length:1302 start_codon:yes stop_codon:yes gene_type:complete
MANQDLDLAGLLTGISNRPQPVQGQPIPGSPNFRGMFGAQMASDLQAGVGKLVRGGAPSQAQKMQQFMSQLDLNSVEDLTKLAKIMQASGDMAGAAKVAAKIQAMQAAGPAAAEEKRRDERDYSLEERKVAVTEAKSARELVASNAVNSQATVLIDALPVDSPLIPLIRAGNKKAIEAGVKQLGASEGLDIFKTIEVIDRETGITNHVALDRQGKKVADLGIAKMPEYETTLNANGTTTVKNMITGSSTTAETVETTNEAILRRVNLESKLQTINNVLTSITGAKELIDEGAAGLGYGLFANMPLIPTDSKQLAAIVTQLNSTLAFGRLQQMRDESKTGGALGSIAVAELLLLQGALQSLDPSAGSEFFRDQLSVVENHYKNYAQTLNGQLPSVDYSSEAMPNHTQLPDGTVYYKDPQKGKVVKLGKTAVYKK